MTREWVMKKAIVAALLTGSVITGPAWAQAGRYERIEGGVVVTPAGGTASRVAVTVHGDRIVHVVATLGAGPL